MGQPSPDQIADILFSRRQVYALDTDSLIRQAAHFLTARALFELLARLDDASSDFASQLSAFVAEFGSRETDFLIGFATADSPSATVDAGGPT